MWGLLGAVARGCVTCPSPCKHGLWLPCKESKAGIRASGGALLDLPGRGDFRTQAPCLFSLLGLNSHRVNVSQACAGDLILESLSTKECDKIPARGSRETAG